MALKDIEAAFKEAHETLPGLKAISAVEVESGLAHGSLIVDKDFDLDAASAYNSEVLKAKLRAKDAMGMKKENVDIIIIELTSQIHLIQPTPNGKYLVYMAADRSNTNIGIARKVVLEVGKKIQSALDLSRV